MVEKIICGKTVKVDERFSYLLDYKWQITPNGYLKRYSDNTYFYMHREVVGAKKGFDVDHINGDRLDNRLLNLRLCSRSQNNFNRRASSANKTGFKGVCFVKRDGKYNARITTKDGKYKSLGNFDTAIEAHKAYVEASKIHHGEYMVEASRGA